MEPADQVLHADFTGGERLLRMAVGWFYLSFYALCFLGLMCIILTICWMQLWHGGFAWDGTILMFNYHPVLMVVGLVVLYSAGEYAVMADIPSPRAGWGRALPTRGWPLSLLGLGLWEWGRSGCLWAQLPWKIGHAALHLLAFILTVLGMVAVFQFHHHSKVAKLYSLHSWLGIVTVFLFACQWFLGFAVFLLPWASVWLRSLLKPIHLFFGVIILSLSIASVISGINEKLFFSLNNATQPYSSLPSEAIFANSLGMLVVIFGLLVLYILLVSSWKRPEPGILTEGQPLLRDGE
ncbi:hypothetical protein GH733_007513 [Mirounga leonina]|nr:hypothetical protein GH733_007513 [Mirounga leonina]